MSRGLRWTPEELKAYQSRSDSEKIMAVSAKPNKYHAKRVEVDGIWFDSKKEAKRYGELKLMQAAGKINNLEVHPEFSIDYNEVHICIVELDFRYLDPNLPVYEDTKGRDTPMSKLKRKLIKAFYGVEVELI